MTNGHGIKILIAAAVVAASAACNPLQKPANPPDRDEPGHEDPSVLLPWCPKAAVYVWQLGHGAALLRTARYQHLVTPTGLPCPRKSEIVRGLPDDCHGIDCGQFEAPIPEDIAKAFEELAGVEPTILEPLSNVHLPDPGPDSADTYLFHRMNDEYEILQAPRDLDLRTVLGVPRDDGDVRPFSGPVIRPEFGSMIECEPCTCGRNPCDCVGGADPGERPEVQLTPDCQCPENRDEREAECARAANQRCDCYGTCCTKPEQHDAGPDA